MIIYLKGHQNYQKFKLIPKSLLLLGSPNLQVVADLMPLETNCHTVPHLKALTDSIDRRGEHGRGSTFKQRCATLS